MIEQIKKEIELHSKIILLRHKDPDGDAIGSVLGLGHFIKSIYPNKLIYTDGFLNKKHLQFLKPLPNCKAMDYKDSLVIICDTANIRRIDSSYWNQAKKIIKIDHHENFEPYGDINWIEDEIIATCEMIAELVKSYGKEIPEESAEALFTGLITDSNRFFYKNTTANSLKIGAYLWDFIPDVQKIYDKLYNFNISSLKHKKHILNNTCFKYEGILFAKITQAQMKEWQTNASVIKSFVNIFANIQDISIWFIAVENNLDKNIKISIRSKGVDLRPICREFGGGGHAFACGAYLKSWQALPKFIKKLKNLIGKENEFKNI